jgi:hypothetical protein
VVRDPQLVADHDPGLGVAADLDRAGAAARLRVDAQELGALAAGDPQAAGGLGDERADALEREGADDLGAARIDGDDRARALVGDPQQPAGGEEAARLAAGGDARGHLAASPVDPHHLALRGDGRPERAACDRELRVGRAAADGDAAFPVTRARVELDDDRGLARRRPHGVAVAGEPARVAVERDVDADLPRARVDPHDLVVLERGRPHGVARRREAARATADRDRGGRRG